MADPRPYSELRYDLRTRAVEFQAMVVVECEGDDSAVAERVLEALDRRAAQLGSIVAYDVERDRLALTLATAARDALAAFDEISAVVRAVLAEVAVGGRVLAVDVGPALEREPPADS